MFENLTATIKRYRGVLTGVGVVTAGNSFTHVVDFLFGVILARTLGAAQFGTFNVLKTLFNSSATITRFGLNNSYTKIVSEYKREGLAEKEQTAIKAFFFSRLAPYIPYVLLGILLAGPLGHVLNLQQEQTPLVRLVFVSVIGVCLYEFVRTRYQADRRFLNYTLLGCCQSVGRVIVLITVFFLFRWTDLNVPVFIWLGFPLLVGLIGFSFQSKHFLEVHGRTKSEIRKMVSFSKWIALSAYSTFLFRGMDVFFLAHYVSKRELGMYSAAMNIANIVFFLTNSLNIVLIPYVCRLSDDQIRVFFKKIFFYGLPIFACCVCIILFSGKYFMLFAYGPEYLEGTKVLNVLLIAFFSGGFLTPFMSIAYRINDPRILFFVDITRGIFGLLGFYFLIPHFGIQGAATSLLVCYLVSCIIGLSLIYRRSGSYLRGRGGVINP